MPTKPRKSSRPAEPVPGPLAPVKRTRADVMAGFGRHIDEWVEKIASEFASLVSNQTNNLHVIAEQLNVKGDEDEAVWPLKNSYYGLTEMFEATGRLEVHAQLRRVYGFIQDDPEITTDEGRIAGLLIWVRESVLADYRRHESSTNGFANLAADHAGNGRGRAYQDADRWLRIVQEQLAKAEPDIEPTPA